MYCATWSRTPHREYEALVEAAERCGPEVLVAVLLGGDAGLRMGEMIALESSDLDFRRRLLNVSRSDWHGEVTSPKGGRSRQVPMTEKLAAALSAHRHLRGPKVLYRHRLHQVCRCSSAVDTLIARVSAR